VPPYPAPATLAARACADAVPNPSCAVRRRKPSCSPPFCRREGRRKHHKEVRDSSVLFVHVLAPCFNLAHLPEMAPPRLPASPRRTLLPLLDRPCWYPISVAHAVLVIPVPPALKTKLPSSRSAKLAGAPLPRPAPSSAMRRPTPLALDQGRRIPNLRPRLDGPPPGSNRYAPVNPRPRPRYIPAVGS
jgi:hypothetical protein